jgi:hypothetical protein
MKIKKTQLRRIICEEHSKLLNEAGYGFTYGRQAGEVSYKEGDIIKQRSFTGERYVKVEYREENIKNDRPGFHGVEVIFDDKTSQWTPVEIEWERQTGIWGYDDQVLSVVESA